MGTPSSLRSSSNSASARAQADAVAGKEQRALARVEGLDRTADFLCDIGRSVDCGSGARTRPGRRRAELRLVDGRSLHVERDVDPDRARAAVQREVDGLLQVVADVGGLEDRHGVLRDGRDDGADVDFLHAELAHAERLAGGIEHAVGALDLAGDGRAVGVESSHAPATPVTALVPPGPVVTMQTPRPLVAFA